MTKNQNKCFFAFTYDKFKTTVLFLPFSSLLLWLSDVGRQQDRTYSPCFFVCVFLISVLGFCDEK